MITKIQDGPYEGGLKVLKFMEKTCKDAGGTWKSGQNVGCTDKDGNRITPWLKEEKPAFMKQIKDILDKMPVIGKNGQTKVNEQEEKSLTYDEYIEKYHLKDNEFVKKLWEKTSHALEVERQKEIKRIKNRS